jgi:putative Holliday junction resolvase
VTDDGAVLAVDFGTRRLGLAVTDVERRFVFGRDTLERSTLDAELAHLHRLCEQDRVTLLVVGIPFNADGSAGPMAAAARDFGDALAKGLDLPLEYVDERYTSQIADEQLKERFRKDTRLRRRMRDRVAASLILQTWLESGPCRPPERA